MFGTVRPNASPCRRPAPAPTTASARYLAGRASRRESTHPGLDVGMTDPADLPVAEGGEDVVPQIAGDRRRGRVGVNLRRSPVLGDVREQTLGVRRVDPVTPGHVGPAGGQEPFGIDLLRELLRPLAPVGVSIPCLPGDSPVLAELPPWVPGRHGSPPSACAARRPTIASGCVSHPRDLASSAARRSIHPETSTSRYRRCRPTRRP